MLISVAVKIPQLLETIRWGTDGGRLGLQQYQQCFHLIICVNLRIICIQWTYAEAASPWTSSHVKRAYGRTRNSKWCVWPRCPLTLVAISNFARLYKKCHSRNLGDFVRNKWGKVVNLSLFSFSFSFLSIFVIVFETFVQGNFVSVIRFR